ncbi:MAG: hypothetical protein IJT73_10740, partial [Selenomonadaceae bacterium]|nr:hypothetical protein [Selenomonadaceae bacterium]
RCDCGNTCIVQGYQLKSGRTQSCGCYKRQLAAERQFKDLTGQTFGRLTVIAYAYTKSRAAYWMCSCICGNECVVRGSSLINGDTQSCGCLQKENVSQIKFIHGMSNTRIHRIWSNMIDRCENPVNIGYYKYGGRGIKVCTQWHEFINFYNYVSKLPKFGDINCSLDRINNNGNYEPDNVRWADAKTQGRNRRNNIVVEYQGVKMTLAEAAEKSGISYDVLKKRHYSNKTGADLFRPVKGR